MISKILCSIKHNWKAVCGPRGQRGWRVCLRCHKFEEKQ